MTTTSATHRHFPTDRPLTPEQLAERLDYWQHKLCLDQWVIDFMILRERDMGDALGSNRYMASKGRATIHLMDPADRHEHMDGYDMEQVLVHELLHLHFSPWLDWSDQHGKLDDFAETYCMEQPIERLSWVLVELDRANALHKGNRNEMATMNAELLDEQTKLHAQLDELTTLLDQRTTPDPTPEQPTPLPEQDCPNPGFMARLNAAAEITRSRRDSCPACPNPPEPLIGFNCAGKARIMPIHHRHAIMQEALDERNRQIQQEGYYAEDDDHFDNGELARAAACYIGQTSHVKCDGERLLPKRWPFKPELWKPKSRRQNLIRGIALAIAEIERLDRATPRTPPTPEPAS